MKLLKFSPLRQSPSLKPWDTEITFHFKYLLVSLALENMNGWLWMADSSSAQPPATLQLLEEAQASRELAGKGGMGGTGASVAVKSDCPSPGQSICYVTPGQQPSWAVSSGMPACLPSLILPASVYPRAEGFCCHRDTMVLFSHNSDAWDDKHGEGLLLLPVPFLQF